jgi:hypothetical protein
MNDDFLYRDVPALGCRMFRLGLSTNYGIEGVIQPRCSYQAASKVSVR